MNKEKIIEILEDYEFFVDDDFGGHYEHINCSQKALTPLGIVEILDYISELEQEVKKQKEVLANAIAFYENNKQECVIGRTEEGKLRKDYYLPARLSKTLIDKLKEVSE